MKYSETLQEKRSALIADADQLVAVAQTEQRDLTADEDKAISEKLDAVRDLDEQIKKHTELEARSTQAAEVRAATKIEAAVTTVKSEPRTYTAKSDYSFLRDAFAAQFQNDYSAQERLARHMREESVERRNVTSANFAGLIVPQFLTDLAAPFARAGRPFADRARKHALPDAGLTISISKVTTGSAVAEQSEGAGVQETNMDDTKLDITVKTVAGQQNVSRQAIERGTNVDSLVMADLVSAYHTKVDALLVAATEENSNIQMISYNDASPTVAELYPKLLDAVQRIQTTFFGGPNFILMHPRRLAFILAASDSTGRPLAVPAAQGPFNNFASGEGSVQYGNSGYAIAGLPVITDGNCTTTFAGVTTEDVITVGNLQEVHLWEQGSGEPMMLRFEQPKAAELDITAIVYGYVAYSTDRYPNAFRRINGSGTNTPTF